jgi:hypothetical protein
MDAYQYFEVLDLSTYGGKLTGENLPPRGKTALFRLNGYETLCKIIWSDGTRCGLQFEEPIPPRVLKHFHDKGSKAGLQMTPSPSESANEV